MVGIRRLLNWNFLKRKGMTLSLLLTNSIKIKISFKILISFLDYIFFIKILPLKIIFKSFNLICKLSFLSCLLQYFF